MNQRLVPIATGLAALGILFGGAACTSRSEQPGSGAASEASTPTSASTSAATSSATQAPVQTTVSKTTELSVQDLVKLAEPSIVRIETGGGVGSGFIISEDGYLVTNNHVVLSRTGAVSRTVNVTLSDGSNVSGTVVGTDSRSDLALVKIEGGPFKALKIGKLDEVQIGMDVVAIGYALDLKQGEGPSFSVTRGIVSQKNRAISEASSIFGAVQTDAAINHGNSGGPLLNLKGEVIGVNTAIAPDTTTGGTAAGIGFAVGADVIKAVTDELRANGVVSRGFLGIGSFEALRPARAKDLGLPSDTAGIYLKDASSVSANGPAGLAGLRAGDVITTIDGAAVKDETGLALAMIRADAGRKVDVEFYRGGKKQTVSITLGTPPATP